MHVKLTCTCGLIIKDIGKMLSVDKLKVKTTNIFRNAKLKPIKTNTAIWFNKICRLYMLN